MSGGRTQFQPTTGRHYCHLHPTKEAPRSCEVKSLSETPRLHSWQQDSHSGVLGALIAVTTAFPVELPGLTLQTCRPSSSPWRQQTRTELTAHDSLRPRGCIGVAPRGQGTGRTWPGVGILVYLSRDSGFP